MWNELLIGVDIGGTFTDLVVTDAATGERRNVKTLTTADPVEGVMTALRDAMTLTGASPPRIRRFVHATTLPTNLVLERKGAKVGFLVTQGFGAMFAMNKQYPIGNAAYDLDYRRPPAFVGADMVFEIDERLMYDGKVKRALDAAALEHAIDRLVAAQPEAVAICLLHSYANPAHERQVADRVRSRLRHAFVAVSSEIWPECGEYERATTTVISAYVGALFSAYLERLGDRLAAEGVTCGVQVMQSNGGVMAAADSGRRAAFAIESGPAAGVMAATQVSRSGGYPELISFDMGGTTAKAGLIVCGEPRITNDFRVGMEASAQALGSGEPLRIPVIDLAEVGAGGGSIAWVDSGNTLRVGPMSAGSLPGPACYGLGGIQATVTDANLLLGYLDPGYFLGGKMAIDVERSRRAIAELAQTLKMDVVAVAKGIHDLANTHMGGAIRIVTLHRGHDPREAAIAAFGGAGPLHVVNLAEQFDIPVVVVPPSPGVMSAFGLLISDLSYDYLLPTPSPVADADVAAIQAAFDELEARAGVDLAQEGNVRLERTLELRFTHQAMTLPVGIASTEVTQHVIEQAASRFRNEYSRVSGVSPVDDVRVVTSRLRAVGVVEKPRRAAARAVAGGAERALKGTRQACFDVAEGFVGVGVYDRAGLSPGDAIDGPAIIEEPESTTICPMGWQARVDENLNIVITRRPAGHRRATELRAEVPA